MSNIDVGNRLKVLRTTLGYSQSAFSDILAISLRALQNYEQGERNAPADLQIALVRKFDVDPVWLVNLNCIVKLPILLGTYLDSKVVVRRIMVSAYNQYFIN